MDEDQEREFYRRTVDTIRNRTGQQLKGMLGPAFSSTSRTPDLMAEAGLIYSTDRFIDDQPFPIHVKSGTLVGVPYTNITNDGMVFKYAALEGEAFVQMCKDQFDVLYAEGEHSGRVLCIALHPYIIGQPHRAAYLDEIFQYIRSHDDVWVTTAAEIAEWYIENRGSHPNGDSRDSEVGVPTGSGGSRD
jgi:peptidoglycan/xylan/chitin deacetylase (PgdA/CDA1 family)